MHAHRDAAGLHPARLLRHFRTLGRCAGLAAAGCTRQFQFGVQRQQQSGSGDELAHAVTSPRVVISQRSDHELAGLDDVLRDLLSGTGSLGPRSSAPQVDLSCARDGYLAHRGRDTHRAQ